MRTVQIVQDSPEIYSTIYSNVLKSSRMLKTFGSVQENTGNFDKFLEISWKFKKVWGTFQKLQENTRIFFRHSLDFPKSSRMCQNIPVIWSGQTHFQSRPLLILVFSTHLLAFNVQSWCTMGDLGLLSDTSTICLWCVVLCSKWNIHTQHSTSYILLHCV